MNALTHPHAGILHINGGIRSKEMAENLQAALEDLSGVYSTELTEDGLCLHFDPEQEDVKIVPGPKLERPVK